MIISQSSDEVRKEAEENFRKIQPYLDQGYGYAKACMLAGLAKHRSLARYRWFKDIVEVGKSKGYSLR